MEGAEESSCCDLNQRSHMHAVLERGQIHTRKGVKLLEPTNGDDGEMPTPTPREADVLVSRTAEYVTNWK